MEAVTFESWLNGIALLTEPQRRWAWQALALSEAAASPEAEALAASGQTHAKPPADRIQPASLSVSPLASK